MGPDGPLDALALREAAGSAEPLERICPERFALPAAPSVAARAEGREVSLDAVRTAYEDLRKRHEIVVVEGAGGLLVPIREKLDMADLAAALGLPLLVVARAALGTINHTLLTLEAAAARELPVLGVVISHAGGELSPADADNLAELRASLGDRLLGELPPLEDGTRAPDGWLRTEALLARLGRG